MILTPRTFGFLVALLFLSDPRASAAREGAFCATLQSIGPSVRNTGLMHCGCGGGSIDWNASLQLQSVQIGPVGLTGKVGVGGAGSSGSGGSGNGSGENGGDENRCWALTIVTPSHREATVPGPLFVQEVGKLSEVLILRDCDTSGCHSFLFFHWGAAQCVVKSLRNVQADIPTYQVVGSCLFPPFGGGSATGPTTPPPSGGKGPTTGSGAKRATTGGPRG